MGAIVVGRTILFTILTLQLLAALHRWRRDRGSTVFWIALTTVGIGLRVALQAGSVARWMAVAFLFLAAGNYLSALGGGRSALPWNASFGGLLLVCCGGYILGYAGLLGHLLVTLMLLLPALGLYLSRYLSIYRRSGVLVFPILTAVLCITLAAEVVDFLLRFGRFSGVDAGLWTSFAPLAVSAYLLWKESRLRTRPLRGAGRCSRILSKLEQAEESLMLQNRFAMTGLLAAGMAHEFKNILSQIQLCADHGLSSEDPPLKNQSLEIVRENVRTAKRSVTSLLDRLAVTGREDRRKVRLGDILRLLQKSINESYRTERIRITLEMNDDPVILIRPGEIEQILLNVIRNAVEAYRRSSQEAGGLIHMVARSASGADFVEIHDSAGGVPERLRPILFDPPSLLKPKSLGLFLSRDLAVRNGARLEYVPAEGGSCFRVIFGIGFASER